VLLMDTLYTLPVLLLSVVLAFLLGKSRRNGTAALRVVYILPVHPHGAQSERPGESRAIRGCRRLPRGRHPLGATRLSAAKRDHLGAGAAHPQHGRCSAGTLGLSVIGLSLLEIAPICGRECSMASPSFPPALDTHSSYIDDTGSNHTQSAIIRTNYYPLLLLQ
jgi:hypothetical protein